MLQIRRFQFHNSPRVLICCDHYLRWSKNWSAVLNVLNTVRKGSTCGCFPHKSLMRSFSGTDCLKSSQSRLPLFVACRCMSTRKTHYEVLGLGKSASSEDIRAAFLKRSKECHPDLNRSNPDNHRQFVQVNEAYSVLSRPQSRKHYDSALDRSSVSPDYRPPPHSDYYHHPRDPSVAEWLRQSGLKEEYFRQNSHQYYGKTGTNKISNFHIVVSCLVFMMTGIVFHFIAVKKSSEKHIQSLNDRDLRTHELWMNAKKAAKEFTPRELTQHLLDKQESQRDQPGR